MSGSAKKLLHAAAGTAASGDPVYVEDCFKIDLYVGTGYSTGSFYGNAQTIVNGIDYSGDGGMVWFKERAAAINHAIYDTVRGATKALMSDAVNGEYADATSMTAFNNNGYTLGNVGYNNFSVNKLDSNYVAWNFKEQRGFFDIVTYEGNGSNRTISHNLGCKPGMILIKMYDANGYKWRVWHKSLGANYALCLNDTSAAENGSASDGFWNSGVPTSSVFSVGTYGQVNNNGNDFVAYLFADGDESDAQIFGEDGDESIIKCGSYTGNGNNTGPSVTLGWEPQLVLIKRSSASGTEWVIADNMRGMPVSDSASVIFPNSLAAEVTNVGQIHPTATGFNIRQTTGSDLNTNSETYIYMAIRRGPMKEPEAGTDVFGTAAATTNAPSFKTGNLVDMGFYTALDGTAGAYLSSRFLQGSYLTTSTTGATATLAAAKFDFKTGWYNSTSFNDSNYHGYGFRRYPKVFDIVTYTGNGSNQNIAHNLGVTPGFVIVKSTDQTRNWSCWHTNLGNDKYILLNTTGSAADAGATRTVNSTNYQIFGSWNDEGVNGEDYIIFLFATLAGISKVGTYEGNGSYQEIDCGFSAQARFVMIKNTEDTTGWQVWDSARGLSQAADPYWQMNGAAEVTGNKNYVYNTSSGFGVQSISGTNNPQVSVSGDTYIYLAFA